MKKTAYESILNKGRSNKREYAQLVDKLRSYNPRKLDALFQEATAEAFSHVDCLECGNCCRALGPKLNPPDISKLATLFKMRDSSFKKQYTYKDEDGDYIFKEMPCPFLEEDNSCFVYDKRPKACRDYPHSDIKKVKGRLPTLLTESDYCPVVVLVFDYVLEKVKS